MQPLRALDDLGDRLAFYGRSVYWMPYALFRYWREVASLALSATVGSGFTAQLGAMRISEEIDALEVIGVPSLPFLVTTRMIAGFVAVIPLYVIGLLSSYFAARTITTGFYGQSTGTYAQYFHQYLPPVDVLYSFIKVLIFAVIIIL